MKQIEYNLLEERWVRVRGQDYTVQEVSLPDALLHAHEYRDLAGELPTQDAAMLRLLLAVLHTVFSRVDMNGESAPFEETDDALVRWGIFRKRPSGPIWSSGVTASGFSTRNAPSGRCRKRRSAQNTPLPS